MRHGEQFVTDAEVYQEILHRYTAIRRPDAIVDEILTFGMSEVRAARALIGSVNGLSARDALHVVMMRKAGTNRILSFDRDYDTCPGVERLE